MGGASFPICLGGLAFSCCCLCWTFCRSAYGFLLSLFRVSVGSSALFRRYVLIVCILLWCFADETEGRPCAGRVRVCALGLRLSFARGLVRVELV